MNKSEDHKIGDLILSIANGDCGAIGEIYRELGGVMYAVAKIYVKQSADVEDVVHESLLKIVQKSKNFRENKNATAWINTIITNTAKDYLRKSNRERKHSHDLLQTCEFDDNALIVREIFSILTKKEKLLLFYTYWYNLSLSEIGKILRIPKSTLKYRIDRVLEKIKKFYKN